MLSVPPRLLVSVRTPEEAQAALEGGADLLDIKDPGRGSLGMATPTAIREILQALHRVLSHRVARPDEGRAWTTNLHDAHATSVPLSLACGEVVDWEQPVRIPEVDAFQYLKFGLAGLRQNPHWKEDWSKAVEHATGIDDFSRVVAVAYVDDQLADSPPIEAVVEAAFERACPGVLFDTHTKTHGRLLDFLPPDRIAAITERFHQHGRFLAAAGSLGLEDLDELEATGVDIIAVRTAATHDNSRLSTIDSQRVALLRRRLTAVC